MSGGPDGSWSVTTTESVPIQWSVRHNENIKWKRALPAGGQSGIAITGKRLFLTMNPPVDTPPLQALEADHESAKAAFDQRYADALSELQNNNAYQQAVTQEKEAFASWETFLETNENYQNASSKNKVKVAKALQKSSPLATVWEETQSALTQVIHTHAPELPELKKKTDSLAQKMKSRPKSPDIILLCLDAETGETLWQRTVKGELPSAYNYGFSDSTTPCPITDGEFVWAINASGGMACFTIDGEPIWERTWIPTTGRPFNKQFDSILIGDLILNVEPPHQHDSTRIPEWNYLHAYEKKTGEHVWTTLDSLTHYNTPIPGKTVEGKDALLIGRGGPHGVPERPVGLSLIDTKNGESLWTWEPAEDNKTAGWGSLNNMHWDTEKTSWFMNDEIVTLDSLTGKQLSRHSVRTVDSHEFDPAKNQYVTKENVPTPTTAWEWFTNYTYEKDIYYLARHAPYLIRHDSETGKTEFLELPRELDEERNKIWKEPQSNDGLNSRGQRNGSDPRTLGDGFQRVFLGSPTRINQYLFFTNALGMVYVLDVEADEFGPEALVAVNDLGVRGETWTVNSLSYARGHLYHRTLKEIICIGDY